MATRFGASSSNKDSHQILKLALAGIAFLLLLLGTALVWSLSDDRQSSLAPLATAEASQEDQTKVTVLVAAKRIEAGTAILPEMLAERQVDPTQLYPGSVFARDKAGIVGMYASTLIKPLFPITSDDLAATPPISTLNIPDRFRAITVDVDLRGAVEGFTKPNTRVDVLWTYPDKECGKALRTLVRFSRVLSLGGQTNPNAAPNINSARTTATLLVSEHDSQKIELARQMGTLSLTLVGDQEVPSKTGDDIVTCETLKGTKKVKHYPGRMEVADPETGKLKQWLFDGEQWVEEASKS